MTRVETRDGLKEMVRIAIGERTQRDIAERCGFSQTTFHDLLRGKASKRTLRLFAKGMGMTQAQAEALLVEGGFSAAEAVAPVEFEPVDLDALVERTVRSTVDALLRGYDGRPSEAPLFAGETPARWFWRQIAELGPRTRAGEIRISLEGGSGGLTEASARDQIREIERLIEAGEL